MGKLSNTFKKFISDESGLELVEYAVMTALIVAAIVIAITTLSGTIGARFDDVETTIGAINTT